VKTGQGSGRAGGLGVRQSKDMAEVRIIQFLFSIPVMPPLIHKIFTRTAGLFVM
jgi:hypothetical protein